MHLGAHGGGGLPADDLEGRPLWPPAAHLPPGPDGAGLLLRPGGAHLLLLPQVDARFLLLLEAASPPGGEAEECKRIQLFTARTFIFISIE